MTQGVSLGTDSLDISFQKTASRGVCEVTGFTKSFRYSGPWESFFTNSIFHSHCHSLSSCNTKKNLWNFKIRLINSGSFLLDCYLHTSLSFKQWETLMLIFHFPACLVLVFFPTAYTSWAICTSISKMPSTHFLWKQMEWLVLLGLKFLPETCSPHLCFADWKPSLALDAPWVMPRCLLFGESCQPQAKTQLRAG